MRYLRSARWAPVAGRGSADRSGLRLPPRANPPPAGTAGLSMLIAWCMGVTLLIFMSSRVAKQAIKIRNEDGCRFSSPMSLSHIVCRLDVACDMFVRF
jgi:hypothetical protein